MGNKEEERPPQSGSELRLMPEARQMSLLLAFRGIVTCRVREDWEVQLPHFANERPRQGKGLARSHSEQGRAGSPIRAAGLPVALVFLLHQPPARQALSRSGLDDRAECPGEGPLVLFPSKHTKTFPVRNPQKQDACWPCPQWSPGKPRVRVLGNSQAT